MYVAPGLLDQRVRLYERHDAGADGFARPVFLFTGEWWGRVDDTADQQTVPLQPQAHVENRITASLFVASYVPVDRNGIVKLGDAFYWVRGVVPVRQLRMQRVSLEAIADEAFAVTDVYENEDVLDGVHLVDPTNAFSDGFSVGFA